MVVERLIHATRGNVAAKIRRSGFRVTPQTKKGTAFCKKDDYDCKRAAAYSCSEKYLEEKRKQLAPMIPTRRNATFFNPAEGSSILDEPEIFHVETPMGEIDETKYDFGFGKDTVFLVDPAKIPCKCGVGDTVKSDETFRTCLTEGQGGRGDPIFDTPEKQNVISMDRLAAHKERSASKFWNDSEIFNRQEYDPYVEKMGEYGMDMKHESPEIWCPCTIPPDAIVGMINNKGRFGELS